MIKHKKRSKRTRLRGSRTAYRGNRKKHKGSGMRGGAGMAGTGKRSGQKITYVQKHFGNDYFGKEGMKAKPKLEVINLDDINKNVAKFKTKAGEINLQGYKILGEGELKDKLVIRADAASESAKEKIKKSGSQLILKYSEKEEKVEDKKTEIKEEKKKEKK